jgi:transposase
VKVEVFPVIGSGEWLDIKEMYRDGVSISEIARRTGHDRKTIRKVVRTNGLVPKERVGQIRGSILDPYGEYIRLRVGEGVLNSCKVLREIQGQGYGGGITLVRKFMHPLRPPSRERAVIRYETQPGEQAQLDLGVFPYLDENGVHRQVYCFAMVLSYSRLLTLEFFDRVVRANVLRGIRNGLEFFQGTPKVLLSDNMKQLVDEIDSSGRPVWAKEYLSMAAHYGFTPRACRPYRAATKGYGELIVM